VLYGREVDVVFLSLLRAQMTFESVEELVAQIGRDVEQTRQLFASTATDELKLLG
jgi:FAD synthase